jgi:hypothetical protein
MSDLPPPVPDPSLREKFLDYYRRNEVKVSATVFVGGFLFDLLTLGRIDDLFNLIQQALYLTLLGTLLLLEIKVNMGSFTLSPRGKKFWDYQDLVVHFLFGSLLSVYVIFYYTSASAITGTIFISLLVGFMFANEFPQFQKIGLPVRVILFSICLLSYFAFFYPILLGHVGVIPFWLGFITSAATFGLIYRANFKVENELLKKHVLYPAIAVHAFFLIGYYTSLIPPVPVAVKKIGVYYNDVEKHDGHYYGHYQGNWYKFWQKGSQDFKARPGDKLTVLLSIFSPGRFEDKVFLKWYCDGELQDSIPLSILGGRDEGFRGFGTKASYRPGDWKVVVETSDGREVGRISFAVENDTSTGEREFKTDVF